MNLTWYARRLAQMSPGEVRQRVADTWLKYRWRARQLRDGDIDTLPLPASVPPFASAPDARVDALPENARARLLRAADAALAGRFRFFDRERDGLSTDPDWFLDPRTGRRAPDTAYAFDIDDRDVHKVGTIKYVWEPSRHYQLTVLAAAYFVTSDARYAEHAAAQLRSWWRRNPFLSGVHWTSGIELGVRLISWVWIRRLLDGWTGVSALFDRNPDFLRQLHHHQDYLAHFRSHGSSANNHLIAEAAGQFAACCAFPYFAAETRAWRERAAATLRHEAAVQTFGSGLNRELASNYHVFVLELLLAAAAEGEAADHPLGAECWQRVCSMIDALAALVDVRGRPPRQGDADHGRGLLLDHPDADPCASLLATGAKLFGPCAWWPNQGATDLRTLLWCRLANGAKPSGPRATRLRHRFADAGMVLLRDAAHAENEIWCRCDHGPHGFLSIAAHAHADALSVELRCGGVEVLVDPGTYTYQGEPKWRSYFRSTIGHNCLELAGKDQSISGGPFMWTRAAKATEISTSGLEGGDKAIWRAAHDGYQRLSPGARHERVVTLHRDARRIVVEDLIESGGEHDCRLAFHVGPELDCYLDGRLAQLSWQTGSGSWRALMRLPETLDWSAIYGQTEPPLGWYSPCFGAKLPITTLVGSGVISGNERLVTEVMIEFREKRSVAATPAQFVPVDSH